MKIHVCVFFNFSKLTSASVLVNVSVTTVSHAIVFRATAALGRHPVDVLRGVLDVTGLAVNAVLGVDLQPKRIVRLRPGHKLVYSCKLVLVGSQSGDFWGG